MGVSLWPAQGTKVVWSEYDISNKGDTCRNQGIKDSKDRGLNGTNENH